MFQLIVTGPLDDQWEERDTLIYSIVGRKGDFSGAGMRERQHGWNIRDFDEAAKFRKELSEIQGLKVSLREK